MAHRNAEFYSQDIVIRVEDELFKVSQHGFSLDQWKSVLKLSNLYAMIEVKKLAVHYMTPLLMAESPLLQIHLAQEHDVSKWLQPAKTRLVERSNPIDENDVRLMGPTFALEVCALREKASREKTLREKTLLEKALRESAILQTVLREKMSLEKLADNISFQKSKKSNPKPSKNTNFDWD